MKVITSLLLVTILVLLSASTSDARRKHRKNYRRNNLHENFEIYHPKGLTIWYPKVRGLVEFGVEVYINQKYGSDELHCDVCLNTTATSYGKFIIHDDDAIIRAGDNLKYKFTFEMANGTIYELESRFYVSASRILRQQKECSSTAKPDPSTEIANSRDSIYEEDINLLENIIYDVFRHCNNVTETSKNLYLNQRPVALHLNPKQLYDHTLSDLQNMLPKINWKTVLVNVFYYGDGIGFEVMSLIDKLKILQMTKGEPQNLISDMDDLDQSTDGESIDEDYNEILFHDVRVAN